MTNKPEEHYCETLPPVPQWWWDYGLQQELDRRKREGIAFDRIITNASKPT